MMMTMMMMMMMMMMMIMTTTTTTLMAYIRMALLQLQTKLILKIFARVLMNRKPEDDLPRPIALFPTYNVALHCARDKVLFN